MKRKLVLLLAPVLGAAALLLGPALTPAKASTPPVAVNTTAARPFLCLGGLPIRGNGAICLNTYQL